MKPVVVILLSGAFIGAGAGAARAAADGERHFTERVQPLLQSKCLSCHGSDKQQGGLRLDSREAVLKGGDTGKAVVLDQPGASLLLQAVTHQKKDLEMPPKEKLTAHEIAVLDRWVRDGLPWPTTAAAGPELKPGERLGNAWSDPRNPIVRIFGGQRLDLWSLQPVKSIEPPGVRNRRWTRTPIDRFVLARLEAAGVAPAPEADRRTLARRLYFDLTGLPPSPEQTQRFLADPRPDAFERLVDELLASPRYGEHQARLWLDVIRYSDSNGFDWDEFRPVAWRFRDYVIRSFNADKPFDQFIREQLAGDEALPGPPRDPADQDRLIATGYLRLGPHDNSAGGFGEAGKVRHALMADLVETTGGAFLGLTLSCCRCHDHKHDPLSQADHYRMRAFFEPVKFADDLPLDVAAEQEAIRQHNAALDARLKPLQQQRDDLLAAVKRRLRDERFAKLTTEEKSLIETPTNKLAAALKGKFEGVKKKVEPSDKEVKAALATDEKTRHEALGKQIEAVNTQRRKFLLGLLMTDKPEAVPVTKVLFQGDPAEPREPVSPGFISALDPNPAAIARPANLKSTGRRTALAAWIASPANPLTARVFVNRLWQQHFGTGLVATPNDFGLAGARPADAALLDWLAGEFVRNGWSVKRLHRLLVCSAAYRQGAAGSKPVVSASVFSKAVFSKSVSSEPEATGSQNGRLPNTGSLNTELLNTDALIPHPRRLSAEQLRDAMLAVAGALRERNGGPPVWPELPREVLTANPAFLDDNETKTKGWYPSPRGEQGTRSVYLVQKRTVRVPFLETFDLPENSTSCARRNVSTVAPQALTLLNDAFAIEMARAFAARLIREAGDSPRAQVDRAFALAFQRAPATEERDRCQAFRESQSLAALCRALLNLNEFAYLD